MTASTLCTLLAQRINPTYFQLWGLEVHWMSPDYDTPENRAIVADVIANYDELAKEWEAKQSILSQIIELEAQQTPRRLREAIIDPTWMNDLDKQIAELRVQLFKE